MDNDDTMRVRRADERFAGDHGWLKSRHTFSFAGFHDPRWMGYGALRVINDDRVAPGGGFPPHGHRDMEILSYVLEGALAHEDSGGARGVLGPGEVQVMSAGSGIRHSEMNASSDVPVRFLQIWIEPSARGTKPDHQQEAFPRTNGLTLIASGDGRDGSLRLGQHADVFRLILEAGDAATLEPRGGRTWIHVVDGDLQLGDQRLSAGDGVGLENDGHLELHANAPVEALIFDLP